MTKILKTSFLIDPTQSQSTSDLPPSYDDYLNSLSQNNPINTQYQNGHQNPAFGNSHFVTIPSQVPSSYPSTVYVIQQSHGNYEMSQIPPDNVYVEEEKPADPCPCVCILMFVS